MRFLTKERIVKFHSKILKETGGLDGIRDEGALDYSIDSINAKVFGQELYPTVTEKACRLCYCLAMDHPFFDGNKRTAFFALHDTLSMNFHTLEIPEKEAEEIIIKLVTHEIDYDEFVDLIKKHVILPEPNFFD